jgi:hypothetical protein
MLETITGKDVAKILEEALKRGFHIQRISDVANGTLLRYRLEPEKPLRDALIDIITMDMGPEFEITEEQFRALIETIRRM